MSWTKKAWFAGMLATTLGVSPIAAVVKADDAAMPAYRADMLNWVKDADSKLNDLAAAMPEAKYSWRPAKGVRSVGEVFLHVAASNYGVPAQMGVAPPEGFKYDGYEQSMTKKADIQKALKDSFAHVEQALTNASEADLDKETTLFGSMKTTVRGGYMLILSHVHEHLGQSIAYARSNGVVPPWTAKQQAAMKEASEKKSDGK